MKAVVLLLFTFICSVLATGENSINGTEVVGLFIGYGLGAIAVLYTWGRIFYEEVQRHKYYNEMLLKANRGEIDKKFIGAK